MPAMLNKQLFAREGTSWVGKPEITQAAQTLFSERGYASTSMRDIANHVGIKAGSLYAHIDNKNDLLFDIIDGASDRFLDGFEDVVRGPGSAQERLVEAMRRHLELITLQMDGAKVFFHEWRSLNDDQRATVLGKRQRYEHHYVVLIEEGVREGVFETPNPRLAATLLLSALNWSYTWLDPDGPMTPDQVAAFFSDFALKGLAVTACKPAPAPRPRRVSSARSPGRTSRA